MEQFILDLRHALRRLRQVPGFTAITVLVLALGVGASTAIFTVVDHILLRPLDLPQGERVVTICETHEAASGYCSVSPVNARDWASRASSLSAVGVARSRMVALREGGAVRGLSGGIASPGFFDALGARPALGRLLLPSDELPRGDGRVVVVAHEFWQTELGGRTDVIGSTLLLDDEPFRVVGVLPEGFRAPRLEYIRLWRPLHFDPTDEEFRDWRGFVGVGRLAGTAEAEAAEAELQAIQRALAEVHPEALRGWGARVESMRDFLVADIRPVLTLFLAAVAVVLLVVCVNLASLLLSRATGRERELAVRAALGAGRGGLARQLLVEVGVLALAGGATGLLVAFGATRSFVALAPAGIPRLEQVALDARIVAFALTVTLLCSVLFGLAPASRAWSLELAGSLRDGRSRGTSRSTSRLRRGLVVAELAMAVTLVFGAGLLLRGFAELVDWRPGFDIDHVLTTWVFLSPGAYPATDDLRAFYDRAERELAAIPGVRSVGTVSAGPLFGGGDGLTPFLVEGRPTLPLEQAPAVAWYDAGPGYFSTLGLPPVRGREIEAGDRAGAPPVAVINEAMARRHWQDADPVGARVRLPRIDWEAEIVGVVPDIQPFRPDLPARPEIYLSNRQRTRWATFFVLRTGDDPASYADAVRATLGAIDPEVSASGTTTLRDYVRGELVRPRFNLALIGLFALVALVLGAAGVYGVTAYAVALRRHEIGVRMALGADRRTVIRWVLAGGLRLVLLGCITGIAGALLFARLLAGLLYGISPADPVALTGTVALLAAAAVLAALVPALRAGGTDPADALRAE